MNGTSQNGKNFNFERTDPRCLERMVNPFEFNIGLSPDKPHRDGSHVARRRSNVSMMSPCLDQVEEKVIISESRNTSPVRKSNGTPMKMLIAQEMSKEVETRRSSPNLVAKLMGLDALPKHEPEPAINRTHFKGHSESHSEKPKEYKDIYGIWEQPQKINDKNMALVRQKFVEAKRMSVDGRLRQSKQYQDALEILSLNKDLFLKCLQEPNSLFSQQLHNLSSFPPPPETKRITVLRPSSMADVYNFSREREGEQVKKGDAFTPTNYKNRENPTQTTRIVVLRPTLEKNISNKRVSSPQFQSERLRNEDFFGDVHDGENQESRQLAKAITNQIRERLVRRNRDESVVYPVLPNGYAADESSFSKSEIEYPADNLSESEAMSPVSRHSWDYVNRLGSPFSSSSFSRASYSPESSVCREAKKRLSERWASMASNGGCQEQRTLRRSSSTLGEMLALSETKKKTPPAEEGSRNEKIKDLNNILISEQGNLTRSKSVPVSSSQFGNRLDSENSDSNKGKSEVVKDDRNARSVKLSFRGKVSSLFFSRNKKASKDKSEYEIQSFSGDFSTNRIENFVDEAGDHSSSGLMELSSKASSSCMISPETQFSVSKSVASGNPSETQEQPSPVSVLDPPFDLNERTSNVLSPLEPDHYGFESPLNSIGSNLIDKSPPIGSVARTLSFDDSSIDTASSYPRKEPLTTQNTNEEGQEWYVFVKTLLSVPGLQGEAGSNTLFARWHSPESPLDPSLRENYLNLHKNKTPHEAKRRQKRSMQKLVFDRVNSLLIELTGYGSGSAQRAVHSSTVLDEVWACMDAWFCGECVSGGDQNGLVVERVVRNEVAGNGWVENLRLERGILGKEIEGGLFEELLMEAMVELTGRL